MTDNEFEEDHLTGLRLHLTDGSPSSKALNLIGTQMEMSLDPNTIHYSKKDQPASISLLFDTFGICDVIVKRENGKQENLSADNADCKLGLDGITERSYMLPKETPLVGFHGMSEEEGLDSLGLILFDAMDE